MSTEGPLYCLERITDPAYRALYERLEAEGVCQFCPEGVRRGYVKILFELRHWYVVKGEPQYRGTTHHWTAFAKKHAVRSHDRGAGDELLYIRERFMRENGVASVAMAQRKGEMTRTCASVAHEHVHFTAASPGKLGDKTFQVDLGYWPPK